MSFKKKPSPNLEHITFICMIFMRRQRYELKTQKFGKFQAAAADTVKMSNIDEIIICFFFENTVMV